MRYARWLRREVAALALRWPANTALLGALAAFLLLLGAQTCFAPHAAAQRRPDWNLLRTTVDQYGVGELRAPRIVHHALGAALTVEAYRGLRALRLPANVAAPVAGLTTGLAPHVVGVARGVYPFDGADWAADLWIRGGAAMVSRAWERKQRRALTSGVYLVGWGILAGWASP